MRAIRVHESGGIDTMRLDEMPVTLNSAPRHVAIRQALTLETGTPSRSKSAPHHTAIRHLFRRHLGTHLSGSLLTTKVYIASVSEGNYYRLVNPSLLWL
jgi:hypothetical protein